mmetsp:Transcript_2136/g.5089  ORF Transcript_2136/g.5089 Transcript_2136/m.5089 type:complete len:234 (+) Transcript_2136:65-766(+)
MKMRHHSSIVLSLAALSVLAVPSSAADRPRKRGALRRKRADRQRRRGDVVKGGMLKDGGLEEDVAFWAKLNGRNLQMSAPTGGGGGPPLVPTPTPPVSTPIPTFGSSGGAGPDNPSPEDPAPTPPTPVVASTPFPTYADEPSDPVPSPPSSFNCPAASFVGCTAPDPNNPEDECSAEGAQCNNGNEREFCCSDNCPRLYCTEKEAIQNAEFDTELSMSMRQRKTMSEGEYLGM